MARIDDGDDLRHRHRREHRRLRALGIEPITPTDDATTGPASFIVVDPDGNPILVDQRV